MWMKNVSGAPEDRAERIQFLCLLAAAAVELLFFLLEDRVNGIVYSLLDRYLTVPAMIFMGASLCRGLSRRGDRPLLVGAVILGWFFLTQTIHQVMGEPRREIGTIFCAYALFLPFASETGDGKRQRGLLLMAKLFAAVGAMIVAYAGLLLLDAVPAYLQRNVYWDGARLVTMGHPNICATLLMIGAGLAVGFAFRVKSRWAKALLLALAAMEFAVQALTNGRTTIVFTCALLGGLTFCALRGTGWKRLVAALLAAAVVMAGTFLVSRRIFEKNDARLSAIARQELKEQSEKAEQEETKETQAEAQEETQEETQAAPKLDKNGNLVATTSKQSTLSHDLKTLNGRTKIWTSARYGLRDNPQIRYIGTEYAGLIVSQYNSFRVDHTHNSWLEVLYRMGIPGLAAALLLTAVALWDAAVLLWRNTDLWKSSVALLALCLLGCAMLEPYLFLGDVTYHFLDFLFLMCLGYMHQWVRKPQGGEDRNV